MSELYKYIETLEQLKRHEFIILKEEITIAMQGHIKDIDYLERLLDRLLNVINSSESEKLYFSLCDYVSLFEPLSSEFYKKTFYEMYGEVEEVIFKL